MTTINEDLLPRATPVQLIDAKGKKKAGRGYTMPDSDALVAAYGALIRGRRINEQCNALVRQGRLAVYPSSQGQEACQVAAALVLGEDDWLFPTYRDSVTVISRGVSPAETLVLLKGDWHSGYDPYVHKVAPQATPLATQLLHAVGVAHAAKMRGEDGIVLAMCGDGATSEGDFHEALNFAAVFKLPVIFFVQNNEFAISVPLARQTAAPSLAHKAIGYGIHGQRVDGNDLAALLAVLGEAAERARSGGGPTLVEAHTYRMQAHTNADDDTRYRERDEVKAWLVRDPIVRMEAYLRSEGLLTPAVEEEFTKVAEETATALREAMNAESVLDPNDLFEYVYAEPTPQLIAQRQIVLDEIARQEA